MKSYILTRGKEEKNFYKSEVRERRAFNVLFKYDLHYISLKLKFFPYFFTAFLPKNYCLNEVSHLLKIF